MARRHASSQISWICSSKRLVGRDDRPSPDKVVEFAGRRELGDHVEVAAAQVGTPALWATPIMRRVAANRPGAGGALATRTLEPADAGGRRAS